MYRFPVNLINEASSNWSAATKKMVKFHYVAFHFYNSILNAKSVMFGGLQVHAVVDGHGVSSFMLDYAFCI